MEFKHILLITFSLERRREAHLFTVWMFTGFQPGSTGGYQGH